MGIIDLIFPKSCLGCSRGENYICDSCLEKAPKLGWHENNTFSIWRYTGVIRKAVLNLKYKYSTEIAKELAKISVRELKKEGFETKDTLLVPIPLHWKRQNLRGFNQSEEIGKLIAKGMGWEFAPNLLVKKKPTKSQVELRGKERKINLEGVFEVNSSYKPSALDRKTLVIFDDVYTTGSTLEEACGVLKNCGVDKIYNLTIAR